MPTINAVLGEAVHRYRKLLGLSQEELAAKIGVTRNTINRYESGQSGATLDTISRLAQALGINETDLVQVEASEPRTLRILETTEQMLERMKHALSLYDFFGPELTEQIIALNKANREELLVGMKSWIIIPDDKKRLVARTAEDFALELPSSDALSKLKG